jgi:hypothetical protein
MPSEFNSLAVYNAERARGLMHTAEYDAKMLNLQTLFDKWAGEALGVEMPPKPQPSLPDPRRSES